MKIIAHRGASSYKTENTMPAFETAIDMQADGIELDVRLTKDGIPVIHHDPTIKRLSKGKGFIHELTLEQLQTYTFKKKAFPLQKRARIVTLEEFFKKMQSHPNMEIHIELKNDPMLDNDLEQVVLQLTAEHQMENQVVYSSFDHQLLKRLATLHPTAKIGLLFNTNLIHLFEYITQTGLAIHSLHPKHTIVTKEMIQHAHQEGMQVNPYTVNSKRVAKRLKKLGVDGIITNDPKIMRK